MSPRKWSCFAALAGAFGMKSKARLASKEIECFDGRRAFS
jgi:hypothetical protein